MKLNYGELNNYILTYFIQDMLEKSYLVSSSIYVSQSHTKKICTQYLKDCRLTFQKISSLIKNKKLKKSLKTSVRSDAFQRL